MIRRIKNYLSLVTFSHTVFALPFAMTGFVLGITRGGGTFTARTFLLVILCMVFARSAAMAFNRYIDRAFDAKNPRTARREIPAGTISPAQALTLVIICALAFVFCAWLINPLCFYLSPVALLVILGYSLTKRFTALCHLVLGAGLALAPIGAYISVTSTFALLPVLFSFLVFFWVSGFDIIYALQDDEFDRSQQLNSIPVLMGRKNALLLSRFFHLVVTSVLFLIFSFGVFHWLYLCGAAVFVAMLIYQHTLVKPDDLSRVTLAFGTTNGIASVVFAIFCCADLLFLYP